MKLYLPKVSLLSFLAGSVLFSCQEHPSVVQRNSTVAALNEPIETQTQADNSRDFVRFPIDRPSTKKEINNERFVTRLDELFSNYVPKDEVFTINPADESFLETENGTQLYFQPESFLTSNGKIVQDSVEITVKVFDDYVEFAAGNLVTETTKGEFLQSGGMFHLAANSNGEEVFLDPNLPAQISLPVKGNYFDGMHSYYGAEEDGVVKWTDAKNAFPMYNDKKDQAFGKPAKKFHLSIKAAGNESGKAIESFISEGTEENWLDWMERQNLSGTELENYLSTTNHWINLNLKFAEDGSMVYLFNEREIPQDVVTQLAKVLEKAPKIMNESTQGAQFTDRFQLKVTGSYDSQEKVHSKRAVKVYGSRKYEKVDTLSEDLIKNYVLSVRSLGYINCDMLLEGTKQQKASVRLPDEIMNPKVWIIFSGIIAVVRGVLKGNDVQFPDVPVGMSSRIIAIGEKDGIPVMSETHLVLEKQQAVSNFTRFSYNQLEQVFK